MGAESPEAPGGGWGPSDRGLCSRSLITTHLPWERSRHPGLGLSARAGLLQGSSQGLFPSPQGPASSQPLFLSEDTRTAPGMGQALLSEVQPCEDI